MLDFCLSGNCFFDEILIFDEFPIEDSSNTILRKKLNIGGIFNVEREILKYTESFKLYTTVGDDYYGNLIKNKYLDKKYDIKKINGKTSHSYIINSLNNSKRTSLVDWGIGKKHITNFPEKCKWHHISYLDSLVNFNYKNIEVIKENSEILTIDLCMSKITKRDFERILDSLKFVDGIICSDSEIFQIFKKDNIKECLNYAINFVDFCLVHSNERCYLYDKNRGEIEVKIERDKGVDTLGAGDIFCANFMIEKLNGSSSIKSIEESVKKTKKILLDKKYDKI